MTNDSIVTKSQKRKITGVYTGTDGTKYKVRATFRFDDECGNGHNTFAVTADVYEWGKYRGIDRWENISGGCCHEDVAKAIPEYGHLLKWHLCSTEGPMHYVENTLYLAGDRDCWGLQKGEFQQFKSRETGLPLWELDISRNQCRDTIESEDCPPPVTIEYHPYGRTGEGKERELDSARRCAIWPEATDEELTLPKEELERKLKDRLPGLMEEFRKDMEDFGFVW